MLIRAKKLPLGLPYPEVQGGIREAGKRTALRGFLPRIIASTTFTNERLAADDASDKLAYASLVFRGERRHHRGCSSITDPILLWPASSADALLRSEHGERAESARRF